MKTWRERIAEARERGRLSLRDYNDLLDFKTCFVGEQHRNHPEVVVYNLRDQPIDPQLIALGTKAVPAQGLETLETLLDQIEDRVLQLKREKM